MRYIRCSLNDLKLIYFSNFGLFLPSPKLIFPFVLVQVLNYLLSFSLFWVGFLNQHLLGLSKYLYFFFGKTRVVKLLIIYFILKIIKYIEGCDAVQFLWFSYYKTANRTAPCGMMRSNITCSAVRLCHFTDGFDAVFVVCAVYTVR